MRILGQHRKLRRYLIPCVSLLLFALLAESLSAQVDSLSSAVTNEPTQEDRSIRISVTPGLTARIAFSSDADSTVDAKTGGPGGVVRFSLVPEHALSIGIETGFISMTSVRENPGVGNSTVPERVVLRAIPILLTLGMGNEKFEVGGGIGYYDLIAIAGAQNSKLSFQSHDWEIGFMLNASYSFQLSKQYKLGPSLRAYNFADRPITVLMLGLTLEMRALEL